MKLALRVRDPFHLDGKMLVPGTLLTDEQAQKVHRNIEHRRRCTQEVVPDSSQAEPAAPQAPVVEGKRTKPNARQQQE